MAEDRRAPLDILVDYNDGGVMFCSRDDRVDPKSVAKAASHFGRCTKVWLYKGTYKNRPQLIVLPSAADIEDAFYASYRGVNDTCDALLYHGVLTEAILERYIEMAKCQTSSTA